MFASPFLKISKTSERKLTYIVFFLLIITLIAMRYFNIYLQDPTSPNGIIDFELAKTLERSQEILNGWGGFEKTFAGLSLGFDFLFLIIYTLFIALLIHKLNERLWTGESFYKIGEILIWSMFFAAIFDIVENICLIKLLIGNLKQYWSSLAYYFAVAKFIFIIISVFYIVVNTIILLLKKQS